MSIYLKKNDICIDQPENSILMTSYEFENDFIEFCVNKKPHLF